MINFKDGEIGRRRQRDYDADSSLRVHLCPVVSGMGSDACTRAHMDTGLGFNNVYRCVEITDDAIFLCLIQSPFFKIIVS